jgi:hypothetical protein
MRTAQELKERMDFVKYSAKYTKENPQKARSAQNAFLDSLFLNARKQHKKILSSEGGAEKLIKIYNITNPKIIARLKEKS